MIGRLAGRVLERHPGEVVLDVGGVGYQVHIPLSTYWVLSDDPSRPVTLHVHTHVREEALQLFGFATPEERAAFQRLLAVSGVGPKLALAVLSGIEAAELTRAVEDGDRARLERIPGIGRKTAERILLELRSRAGDPRRGAAAVVAGPPAAGRPALRADAVSALENLGYGRGAAWDAVVAALEALGDAATLEKVLRDALRSLMR